MVGLRWIELIAAVLVGFVLGGFWGQRLLDFGRELRIRILVGLYGLFVRFREWRERRRSKHEHDNKQ